METTSAVIELGTRGIRLLVAEIEDGVIERVIKSTGDLSNLGKEADASGAFSAASIKRVVNITRRYKALADKAEVERIEIIATDALRHAPNIQTLLKALAEFGQVEFLSPQEEAVCMFVASVASFRDHFDEEQPILVIDQGGSSTELIRGYAVAGGCAIEEIVNVPIGTTMLGRTFLSHELLSDGFTAVYDAVREALGQATRLNDGEAFEPVVTIAHGSAIMGFARGIFMEKEGYEPKLHKLHATAVSTQLIQKKVDETMPGLKGVKKSDLGAEARPDSDLVTLMSGILTYNELAKQYGAAELLLSREGMRFGALLQKAGFKCEVRVG